MGIKTIQKSAIRSALVLGVLITIATTMPKTGMSASKNNLLSSAPVKTFSSSYLPQWQEILNNQLSETYNSQSVSVKTWQEFIETLQGETKLRQLIRVNQWFKQFAYKQDNWIYKQDDYWASPVEFLTKGGDCEDYAIIKYMTLRKLGFAAKDMKIAMVYDVYSGTDHSFLTVRHNGTEFALDNREKLVVVRYMKNRYKPHYAFNEKNVWVYDSPVMARKMREHSNGAVLPGNR